MKPVCAVTVPYPGVLEWLRHGHAVGLWDLRVLDGRDLEVPPCEWVLLGAWHPSYQAIVDAVHANGGRVAVAWSSSATEMDNALVEVHATQRLVRDGAIDAWLCLNLDLVAHFPDAMWLPAPVALEDAPPSQPRSGVGFYAPATPKKNALTQLLAVRDLQRTRKAVLHTNLHPYRDVMLGYGMDFVLEEWVDRPAHLARLARREACLAASHAESFCYGAADACMAGTPVVGSPTIEWLPPDWQVTNPNSPNDVKGVLYRVLTQPLHDPRSIVAAVADRNNRQAAATIQRLLQYPRRSR